MNGHVVRTMVEEGTDDFFPTLPLTADEEAEIRALIDDNQGYSMNLLPLIERLLVTLDAERVNHKAELATQADAANMAACHAASTYPH